MLEFVCHDDSSKTIYQKVRVIAQTTILEIQLMNNLFGSNNDDIGECFRGINHAIENHPRINTGYLSTYMKVEHDLNSVKIFHETSSKRHLVCEVVKLKEAKP